MSNKPSKIVSAFSANVALVAVAHLVFAQVGCAAASSEPDEAPAVAASPSGPATANAPSMTEAQRAILRRAFEANPAARRPTVLELGDGQTAAVTRTSPTTVELARLSGGAVVARESLSAEMPQRERALAVSRVLGRPIQLPAAGESARAVNTDGMPLGSNGACGYAIGAVVLDAAIITLAVVEVALIWEALAFYIASSQAALLSTTISAEMLVAAEASAGAFLLELGGLLATFHHVVHLVEHGADWATVSALVADAAAQMGLLSHHVAAGYGVIVTVLGWLKTVLDDVMNAISYCTAKPLPPAQNGNPGFTTVGCNQSGGFGAAFDPALARAACAGVIGNWKTDYYRWAVVGSYWTCNDHFGRPNQAPSYVALCNGWIEQCVEATRVSCGGAPPPAPVPAPVAVAVPVE